MKTKHFCGVLLLSLLSICFSGCGDDNKLKVDEVIEGEEVKELRLSVDDVVYIDDLDYTFEILDGNGGYTVSVSDSTKVKAKIEGQKVIVNLFYVWVDVTITDSKGQTQKVIINSSNELLFSTSFTVYLGEGDKHIMKNLGFGVGGYSLEKIKGSSAEITVDEKDCFTIKALKPGNTYFTIKDSRGATTSMDIIVELRKDLESNRLVVEATNDMQVAVTLKWGDGEWQLVETPESDLIESVVVLHNGATTYDKLQINTTRKDSKGTVPIQLKDKTGNTATITLNIN